jgi:hypothetical protein
MLNRKDREDKRIKTSRKKKKNMPPPSKAEINLQTGSTLVFWELQWIKFMSIRRNDPLGTVT